MAVLLALIIPYKTGGKVPQLLADFLTHDEFPISESDWSFVGTPPRGASSAYHPPTTKSFPKPSPKAPPQKKEEEGNFPPWPKRQKTLSFPSQSDSESESGPAFGSFV